MTPNTEPTQADQRLRDALRSEKGEWTPACLDPHELIDLHEQGARAPRSPQMLAHIADCAYCRRGFAEVRATLQLAQELRPGQDVAAPPDEALAPANPLFWQRVRTWLFPPGPNFAFAAGAAALLLGAGLTGSWLTAGPYQGRVAAQRAQVAQLTARLQDEQRAAEAKDTALARQQQLVARQQAQLSRRQQTNREQQAQLARAQQQAQQIQRARERLEQQMQTQQAQIAQLEERLVRQTRRVPASGPQVATRIEPSAESLEAAITAGRLAVPVQVAQLSSDEPGTRGSADGAEPVTLLGPVHTFVRTRQPTLRWLPAAGAGRTTRYQVTVTDGDEVLSQGSLPSATAWRVPVPLAPGKAYEWQVTTRTSDQTSESAIAKFQVLDQKTAEQVAQAERRYENRPLTLAVLYARLGLLDDAERQLQALVKNPDAPLAEVANRLLRDLRSKRQAPPAKAPVAQGTAPKRRASHCNPADFHGPNYWAAFQLLSAQVRLADGGDDLAGREVNSLPDTECCFARLRAGRKCERRKGREEREDYRGFQRLLLPGSI